MNRELETRYTQMKLMWKNLVNANIDLVDENKILKEEVERLNNIINEFEDWLNAKYEEMHDIWYIKVLNKLKELKGSDK